MKIYKKWFWILLAPALILFTLVILIPFITGIFYSFTDWRGTYFINAAGKRASGPLDGFVGLANYKTVLTDKVFLTSFFYTVKYTIVAVFSITFFSLCLALLLDRIIKAVGLYRTVYFLPNLLGGLALGFIWQFIFEIIYTDLIFSPTGIFHIEAMRYMTQDSTKALFALVIMTTWQFAGYMMIIFITGINNIPKDLYEAADIDGAGSLYTLFNVTLPMLMSSFTVVIFLNLANSFKLLDQNVALTDGNFNTRMLALQILKTVEKKPYFGEAQAQAVIFFIVVSFITLTQVSFTKRKEVEM